jgi:hypothetical protein
MFCPLSPQNNGMGFEVFAVTCFCRIQMGADADAHEHLYTGNKSVSSTLLFPC